jgi:hypothetical protein
MDQWQGKPEYLKITCFSPHPKELESAITDAIQWPDVPAVEQLAQ